MRSMSDSPTCTDLLNRSLGNAAQCLLLLALGTSALILSGSATAQSGAWTTSSSSLCSRDNALEIIQQQIDATKTFDDSVQRITVLIRAADLLWPYQQKKAHATFAGAFELAGQNFKENGDEPKKVGRAALVETPDQRYLVIRAIAKRDLAWARDTFVPNGLLQRRFVQTLLRRAQQALVIPLDEGDNYNEFPGTGHILQVLTRVEPRVQNLQPDLVGALEQARNNLLGLLSPERQSLFLTSNRNRDSAPIRTFDEQIEAAKKESNVNRRDELMVTAILSAVQTESVDHVVNTADKIADSNVRAQLLDWFYFIRAQRAVKDKRLDEATKLAAKVREMDQRAYLYSEIAKESLQNIENQHQARELLDDIVTTASKGPNTIVTARTLLAAAYLYSMIDPSRSISILGDAISCINRLESPDFAKQSLIRKIEGRNFARYAVFRTTGFDPENAFREMAKIDFDGALSQASAFTDKSLRALTTLVLADFCLQRAEQQEKAQKAKKKAKP